MDPVVAHNADLLPTDDAVAAAPTQLGRYQLLGPMASGGMAEVFLARATGLGGFAKRVVIKRLHRDLAGQEPVVRMFLDEARLSAALQHPNIVQVLDVDRGPDGVFMVMEFLHGRDLITVLRRVATRGARLPLSLALFIARAICAGLHHAHELTDDAGRPLGLIHRDVSPHNVFATFDGAVKVIDFGIAKAENRLGGTRTGTIKGKLGYMAPEQCRGLALDRRCDVFCAGIVLFELTTSRKLFRGSDDYELLRAVVERPATRPGAVVDDYPAALEEIVMRALAPAPADRYPTALALGEAIDEFRRAHGMTDGAAELATYLRELFAPEVAAWEAARGDAAAQLAALRPTDPSDAREREPTAMAEKRPGPTPRRRATVTVTATAVAEEPRPPAATTPDTPRGRPAVTDATRWSPPRSRRPPR
jgi:serine/threonine protein kinase